MISQIKQSVAYIQKRVKLKPKIAIILGSGLSGVAGGLKVIKKFSYKQIPHFSSTSISGHPGKLIFGRIKNVPVLIMQGRPHFYEGYTMQQVRYPVYIMNKLGIETLMLTSAAGGINRKYKQGDIVILKDYINLMGNNPLRGAYCKEFGERFVDVSRAYDKALRKLAVSVCRRKKMRAHEGVYAAVCGPSYETPSEVKAFSRLGADVVGMSVVPETIAANQTGIKVLGICYVANIAGTHAGGLSHKEVLKTGKKAQKRMRNILSEILIRCV